VLHGLAQVESGALQEGLAELEHAVSLSSESRRRITGAAARLYKQDRLPNAIALLERTAERGPEHGDAASLLERARSQWKLTSDRSGWRLLPRPTPYLSGQCLVSSVAMVMAHWSARSGEGVPARTFYDRLLGQSGDHGPLDTELAAVLRLGWQVAVAESSLSGVQQWIRDGYPVVAMLSRGLEWHTRHATVIVGFDDEKRLVVTHDPAEKALFAMPYDAFERASSCDALYHHLVVVVCPPQAASQRFSDARAAPLSHAALASAFLCAGRRREALGELARCEGAAYAHPFAALMVAESYSELGRPDKAREAAGWAVDLAPSSERPYAALANAWAGGEIAARAVAQSWLDQPERGTGPALFLGAVLASEGKVSEAIDVLSEAVSRHGHGRQAKLRLAKLYLQQQQFSKALELAGPLVDQDPWDSLAHSTVVQAHLGAGQLAAAWRVATQWLEAQPTDEAPRIARARVALQKDGVDAAVIELEPVTRRQLLRFIGPGMPAEARALVADESRGAPVVRVVARFGVAAILEETQQHEKAVAACRQAIDDVLGYLMSIDADERSAGEYTVSLVLRHAAVGARVPAAEAAWSLVDPSAKQGERLSAEHRERSWSCYFLGSLLGTGGHYAESAALLSAAAEAENGDELCWYHLACASLALGDAEAWRRTRHTMLESECISAAWLCAAAPCSADELSQALDIARSKVAGRRTSNTLRVLGGLLYRARCYEDSLACLKEALDSAADADRPPLLLLTALARQGLGRTQDASASLREARAWMQDLARMSALPWEDRVVLGALRQEAEAAVQGCAQPRSVAGLPGGKPGPLPNQ
jgi:tetratricopeptide (TPR) repeat protein